MIDFHEKYPNIVDENAPLHHPEGWNNIVDLFLGTVDRAIKYNPTLFPTGCKVLWTKEKFGELVISLATDYQYFRGMARMLEIFSSQICQLTGEPGKTRDINGWYITVSDKEYEKAMKQR